MEGYMNLIFIRKNPEYKNKATQYFQNKWGNESNNMVYEDCITHSMDTEAFYHSGIYY